MSSAIRSHFSICFLLVMAFAVKQSQSKIEDHLDDKMFEGMDYLKYMPDAESAHKYLQQLQIAVGAIQKWVGYVRDFFIRMFNKITWMFGEKGNAVEEAAIRIMTKTWSVITEEMPPYFLELQQNWEMISEYMRTGFMGDPFKDIIKDEL